MTAPFGPGLEAALKEREQGGRLHLYKRFVVNPRFFCCLSGTSVGVAKDPVALLIVNPQRVCTGTVVNADYSNSWSPSSTISTWSVDWGDGQINNGAWPGAGNVNHPLGGYVFPGIYNITLTVTDLLGATGVDRIQVEVLDCTGLPGVEAFCGCGASGVWYTNSSGWTWENRGGGILDNVAIYDLSATPSSFGLLLHKVWAATEDGLYLTEDSGLGWRQITEFPEGYTPRAVRASPYMETEVYVLADDDTGVASLLWSQDDGDTWVTLQLGNIENEFTGFVGYPTHFLTGRKLLNTVGVPGAALPSGLLTYAAGQWSAVDGGDFDDSLSVEVGLFVTGDEGAGDYDGVGAWQYFGNLTDGQRFIYAADWNIVTRYILVADDSVWYIADVPFVGWQHLGTSPWAMSLTGARSAYYYQAGDYILIQFDHRIIRCQVDPVANTAAFYVEWYDPDVTLHAPLYSGNPGNVIYVSASEGRLLVRDPTGPSWDYDVAECPYPIISVMDSFPGINNVYVATSDGVYQRNAAGTAYTRIVQMSNVERVSFATNLVFMKTSGTYPGIYRAAPGTYTIPADNYHHFMDINASGEFIYLSLIDVATGNPVVMRISYDLEFMDMLYEPGAGTWGGVAASKSDVGTLWVHGDFGAATKVLHSEDLGETLTDITDAGWNANEVVSAITPSIWDVRDAIAVLDVAQETYITRDAVEWAKTGDTAFGIACATRDPLEAFNLFLGREDEAGPPQLQYSPNEGVGWLERSTGIGAGSPITVIEVVG